jgi:hypothetical protein
MRCFYHGDVEAVAVCKACGHGVCHDCCADAGTSTACRNRCETEVIAIDDLRRRSTTLAKLTSKLYYGLGVGAGSLGLLVFISSLPSLRTDQPNIFGIVTGFIFLAGGLACVLFARRSRR